MIYLGQITIFMNITNKYNGLKNNFATFMLEHKFCLSVELELCGLNSILV